jgi:GTP-binding protein
VARPVPAGGLVGETAPDADAIEQGRRLFAQECTFVAGGADLAVLPEANLPEIAFAGRSNVGKSSLVNALTGRNTLARTSRTPGRTRQINFFRLGNRLMLVDLPGYGYARAPKHEIAAWTELVRGYLRGRVPLRRVCLLIDARHGLKPADREVIAMMGEAAVSYQAVLTKADKARPAELAAVLERLAADLATHGAAHPGIAVTSALKGAGVAELRAQLAALAEAP